MSNFSKKARDIRRSQSFAEKLCYGRMVGDDVIMNKDGTITCYYRFFGEDIQVMSEQRQALICERYSKGAGQYFQDNLLIESDFIRYKASEYAEHSNFPDAISELIDVERRLQFEQSGNIYENIVYYAFTVREPVELPVGIKKAIYDSSDEIKERTTEEKVADFKTKLEQYISFVSYGKPYQYELLSGDKLITCLNTCITHETRTLQAPKHKSWLDSYLAKDFLAGFEPQIGKKHIKTIAVDMLPEQIHAMLMDELNSMSIEFRFHSRFMLLSRSEAAKHLKRLQRTWSSKAVGIMGHLMSSLGGTPKINESAQQNNFDMQACISENESQELKFGWYNLTFILMNEDMADLNQSVKDITKVLEGHNLQLREEAVNAAESYLGSLPAHGSYDARINIMDSKVWSYTLPLSSIYSGEKYHPNPYYPKNSPALLYGLTGLNNIFRFSNSVGDVQHMLIIGPTGAGKTTLLGILMAQFRKYENARQIILDCNQSSMVAVMSMGGRYINVSEEGEFENTEGNGKDQLALFDGIEVKKIKESIIHWLVDMFTINGVTESIDLDTEVRDAVERIETLPKEMRTFKHLIFDSPELRKTFKELSKTIFGGIIDGSEDFLTGSNLTGIEIGELGRILPAKHMQPLVQLLLDKLTNLFQDRLPTMLILDEAWLFLDHPIFSQRIKEWLKTLRKLNVGVVFSSQSLADVAECSITSVLIESCLTKIYLPNEYAVTDKRIAELYESFGLDDKERYNISTATPKKEYYVKQNQRSRMVDFNIGEVALQFVSVDKKSDRETFFKFYDATDSTWPIRYLEHKELPGAAEIAKTLLSDKEVA